MYKRVRFGFVLTEDEKQALVKLAEAEGGLSEAAMLRRLIRRAAKEQDMGIRATTLESGKFREMRGQSERISG